MNSNWNDFLAKQGAQDNFEHFGDLAGELAASRSATIAAPLTDQGVIRATGEETAGFLHNLLTNDINHIPADGARLAGMCTAKGRLIASFLVWREGADFLLQLSADILPAIHKKLSMYVLRSKVKQLDASDERALLGATVPPARSIIAAVASKSLSWRRGSTTRSRTPW
mgnify:CR=1 FL=1